MVRSSWRSSVIAALAAAAIAGATAEIAAHRLDEYLQAARLALDPDRVHLGLDLTAGTAVAGVVLSTIDRDRSGTISAAEGEAYAAVVRGAIRLELDGRPLSIEQVATNFPAVEAMRTGDGAIRLELSAAIPPLSAGLHHLLYRNTHRPDISVYLANVLVPASDRVSISAQRRDVDQRELIVDYVLDANRTTGARAWVAAAVAVPILALASLWWRWRASTGG
jgi:hypothetical protein